jgi:predicted nucleic acid-binding protein
MNEVVYDAAVLVAADRNNRRAWADHRARLERGMVPLVPATVVAQVSRSPQQAQLRRFLRGCEVAVLDERRAHEAGRLLARANTSDVVDASVVALAVECHAHVITGDPADLERLAARCGAPLLVIAI